MFIIIRATVSFPECGNRVVLCSQSRVFFLLKTERVLITSPNLDLFPLDHFHVHITHISAQVAGSAVGQSHLLDTIIDNIENITSDYYSRASLRFALGVNHPVFALVTGAAQK